MARHDIRGKKLDDGSYSLPSKDVYNLNDNFIQLSKEIYGNSDFTGKIQKQVKKVATSVSALETTVGDLDTNYTAIRQDVDAIDLSVNGENGAFSKITILENEVSTKASATYVDTAVDNANKKGLNLITNLPENWENVDSEIIRTIDYASVPQGEKLTFHSGVGYQVYFNVLCYNSQSTLLEKIEDLQLNSINNPETIIPPWGTYKVKIELDARSPILPSEMAYVMLKMEQGEKATAFTNHPPDEGIDLSPVYERIDTAEEKITPQAIINTVESQVLANGSVNIATKSDLAQTATDLTLTFEKQGGKNLITNSGFINDFSGWSVSTTGSYTNANTSKQYPDMPSGCAARINMAVGETVVVKQVVTKGFNRNNKAWTISGYIRNTATTKGTTNPYAGVEIAFVYSDNTKSYHAPTQYGRYNYIWEKFESRINSLETKDVVSIAVNIVARDMNNTLYLSRIYLQEGNVSKTWTNSDNESYGTSHIFSNNGYELKDSNGATLITPMGMANEQNIGRADNVQVGFPMLLPFHIGTEVSQIVQAKLKWNISQFRTYSKGASSGGGSTSGGGGAQTSGGGGSTTTTVGVNGWTQGLAADTSTVDPNVAKNLPHGHTISTSKLAHTHKVSIGSHTHSVASHTHSIPNHTHLPIYGILQYPVSSTWLNIWVDGANVYSVDAWRGEVDLSTWITTNGWHTIELRCSDMFRLDANLFLKTYIRR